MNWYSKIKVAMFQKKASVTFFLPDSHKISQPKTILDLSHELSNFFFNGTSIQHEVAPVMNDISPDGFDDFDKPTGTINVYPRKRVEPPKNSSIDYIDWYNLSEDEKIRMGSQVFDNSLENMMPVIDEWISGKEIEGYKIEKQMDVSNMTQGPVLRLHVRENPSTEYESIPEVNMSNSNAAAVIRSMGLLPEPSGSIDVDTLLYMINQTTQQDMTRNTQPSQIEYDENGEISRFEGGRDETYIDSRIQQLYGLADYAKQNGFKEILWG